MLVNNDNMEELLDYGILEPNTMYTKVAYLYDYDTSTDRFDRGYYVFYLKDCNGDLVRSVMFNTDNFIESGRDVVNMKGKPVKVTFGTDLYNSSISLIVGEMEEYDGDIDLTSFIGKIEDLDKAFEYCNKFLLNVLNSEGKKLLTSYKTASLQGVFSGKVGGYVKLLQMVIGELSVLSNLAGVKFDDLIYVFYISQQQYYIYLKQISKGVMETKATRQENLLKTVNKISESRQYAQIVDTLSSLIDSDSKPEHLYAHLICNAFDNAYKKIKKIEMFNSMVEGSKKDYKLKGDEGVLLKY